MDDVEQKTNDDDAPAGPPGFVARLADARGLLLAVAAVLLLFCLLRLIAAGPALGLWVVIAVLSGLFPRVHGDAPARLARRQPPSVWPDTGVKRMADALPEPCIILDRRGVVRYANALAEATFPTRPGDPLTFRLRAPDFVAAFERVAAGGRPERVDFLERVPTERWYSAWFATMQPRDGEDRSGFVVLIFSDMTERRRSEKIRVDFVANASHELRTPLASLAGFIETLQGPAREDAAARERFLGIMHEQATRMSRLIDDLLSLSRIEMKAHMRPEDPVDLVAVLRGVVDALEPLARDLGVTIELQLPDAPVIVKGDRDELVQVFQNLVENACKYGQSGKRVVVTLASSASREVITVSVRDFGPGIAAEHLPRLTERFYRADVSQSRNQRGTGLGLAIVKHIVNRHKARLRIESTTGEGASFNVEFPAPALISNPVEEKNDKT
ncbi:ATP-binding protein [Kaistia dalseonensis]|uniref:histidine kinase n=1 Tax=Kaistia dalseonensis TaxID=410840 RepID=A0ABU0HDK3_9HYPH|nr:ATP-binding protein [Kaistia dalseonensis]MCX5497757.1 ATP-binding protein [Kaistia dalseonensis]MDQ0440401.1 two-component system phosphate regulon sensor histidine kinase PhoR [Kaistia dalseonensis]